MELELEALGGGGRSRVVSLSGDSPEADLGRGDLAPPADRSVSRRHVSLRLLGGEEPRVAFEVVGRNPVVVRSSVGGSMVYRRGEADELRAGDGLSLSLKEPSFWEVRRSGGEGEVEAAVLDAVARREKRTRERKERERRAVEVEETMEVTEGEETVPKGSRELEDVEFEDLKIDPASIDPVREFGFLSVDHEFDSYPKGRIRPPKDWNWFLEEIKKSSDDEDDVASNKRGKSKGSTGRKKKNEGNGEDEEWTGDSDDEKDSLPTGSSVKRPKKYVTRSKDPKKPRKEDSNAKAEDEDSTAEEDEMEEEDEEDETLGGFIVNEEDDPMDEQGDEDEDEDEFDDEEEDD